MCSREIVVILGAAIAYPFDLTRVETCAALVNLAIGDEAVSRTATIIPDTIECFFPAETHANQHGQRER